MTRRRVAAAALVAVSAVVFGTTGPAAAVPPGVTIGEPAGDARATSPEVRIAGSVAERDLDRVTGSITAVVITVSSATGRSVECANCWAPNGPDATFSWTPRLDFNGPYTVTVRAVGSDLLGSPAEEGSATRGFKVEAPPAPPQDVRVEVVDGRRVTVSWARNTEPDLRGYQLRRVAPGGATDTLVSFVPQPPSGERVSVADPAVPAAGGTYQYAVVAVRPDGDGNVTARAVARSSPAAAEIGAFPVGGGPPVVGGPGPPTAAGGQLAGRPRNAGDPSTFLSGGGELPAPAPLPEGEALAGEDSFSLPGAQGSESSDPAVLGSSSASNQRALFVPIAAGLLLTVLAFHLRQFSRVVLDGPPAYHPLPEWEADEGDARGPRRPS